MTESDTSYALSGTEYELSRRQIASGEARCATFRRTYGATVDDVWEACTNPERLARWYAPVAGELRVGGTFTQGDFGSGRITRCEPPHLLTVALGGDPAPDEIELRLKEGPGGTTVLEFEHATTLDSHTIGGQVFDAVYCMGGGYGPRLISLELLLKGELPEDLDATQLHLNPRFLPAIEASMAALNDLLEADAARLTGSRTKETPAS
jgi:uncharacterized protein YndB with AHSA1/START domain